MRFLLGACFGAIIAGAVMPQYGATLPLQTISYSPFVPEEVEDTGIVAQALGSGSGLCLKGKQALKKLGSRKWEPESVNRFVDIENRLPDVEITTFREADDPTKTFCVVEVPTTFGLPAKVEVRDGILTPTD